MRLFRFLAIVCFLTLTAFPAHAQAESDGFITFSYTHLNTTNVNETDTNGTVVDTPYPVTLNKPGVSFGTDLSIVGPQSHNLSAEIRTTIQGGVYQFLGGARFAFRIRHSRFRPYIVGAGGFVWITQTETITTISKAPFPPSTSSMPFPNDHLRGVFAAFGGVDTKIKGNFDWRIEAGGGNTSSASLSLTASPGGTFFTVSSGPVWRF